MPFGCDQWRGDPSRTSGMLPRPKCTANANQCPYAHVNLPVKVVLHPGEGNPGGEEYREPCHAGFWGEGVSRIYSSSSTAYKGKVHEPRKRQGRVSRGEGAHGVINVRIGQAFRHTTWTAKTSLICIVTPLRRAYVVGGHGWAISSVIRVCIECGHHRCVWGEKQRKRCGVKAVMKLGSR